MPQVHIILLKYQKFKFSKNCQFFLFSCVCYLFPNDWYVMKLADTGFVFNFFETFGFLFSLVKFLVVLETTQPIFKKG